MKENLHNNLCSIRLSMDITQEALGKAVGVTRQTIIAIEKGNYVPSALLALKIAAFCNKTLEEIFFISYEK